MTYLSLRVYLDKLGTVFDKVTVSDLRLMLFKRAINLVLNLFQRVELDVCRQPKTAKIDLTKLGQI